MKLFFLGLFLAIAVADAGVLLNPCKRVGLFAFVDNSPAFYACDLNEDGTFDIKYFNCESGYVFDRYDGVCVPKVAYFSETEDSSDGDEDVQSPTVPTTATTDGDLIKPTIPTSAPTGSIDNQTPAEEEDTTTAPATTDAPATTEEPTTTDAPVTTEEPTTTDAPETTEEPTTTDAPVTTEEPTTTDAPVTTEEPETTDAPVTTEEPTTTDAPVTTEEPTTTDAPETTEEPTTTDAPVTTEEPTTTDAPVTTEEPATTDAPETTEVTVTTDETASTDEPESTTLPAFDCPDIGFYPQNGSCEKFALCAEVNGEIVYYLQSCPKGQQFNYNKNYCDDNFDCNADVTRTKKVIKEKRSSAFNLFHFLKLF
ncbi:cell surface glycoprotein 1 [Bactrocera tryoni]|uniref:cell surface glycoprotein 1 n=1 Tax=Bactrocera tryoni TaxID=59916 RepID=UPI001A98BFD6|nr:cell surface glycoprotein 1 [Bactrocera tryoni]